MTTNPGKRAEALAPPAPGWQPIETAPKDGRYLLLHTPHRLYPVTGYWLTTTAATPCWWEVHNCAIEDPTHWMPMLAPPRAEAREARPFIRPFVRKLDNGSWFCSSCRIEWSGIDEHPYDIDRPCAVRYYEALNDWR